MSVDERMLIEPLCVTVHSWNRAKSTNIINFGSTVLVQGCGPIGLSQIAVLKAAGVVNIIAVDGVEKRLELAKEMGIPVEKLVTHHYPLEQYVDAMEKNISLEGVKIAIVME